MTPAGVGAVPAAVLPEIRLLPKDDVAPVMPVPLNAMSVLEIRIVVAPPLFWMPVPLLLMTLLLMLTSVEPALDWTKIPALTLPENSEFVIMARGPVLMEMPKLELSTRT